MRRILKCYFIPVHGQTSGCVGASSLTECFEKAWIKGSTKPCYALLVANGSGGDGWRQDVLPIRMGGGHIPELLVGRSVLHIGQPEGRKDKSAAFDGSQFNGWSRGAPDGRKRRRCIFEI